MDRGLRKKSPRTLEEACPLRTTIVPNESLDQNLGTTSWTISASRVLRASTNKNGKSGIEGPAGKSEGPAGKSVEGLLKTYLAYG